MRLRYLVLSAALLLGACDPRRVGSIILFRNGAARTSDVFKIGPYCWVAWYSGIEKLLLRRDGSAFDLLFYYRWTLDVAGPDDVTNDLAWFDNNCRDPKEDSQ